MPFSVARSFSEAELMSMSSAFLASVLAGAASFLASVLAGAAVLGVSAFWAKAMLVAARAATRKAKILFIAAVPPRSGWGQCDAVVLVHAFNAALFYPLTQQKSPAGAGLLGGAQDSGVAAQAAREVRELRHIAALGALAPVLELAHELLAGERRALPKARKLLAHRPGRVQHMALGERA